MFELILLFGLFVAACTGSTHTQIGTDMRTARATPSQMVRPVNRAAAMRMLRRLGQCGFKGGSALTHPGTQEPSLHRIVPGHCHIVSDRSGLGTGHTGDTWYTLAIMRLSHIKGRGLQFEERIYSITD
jgi:hypothetical protein